MKKKIIFIFFTILVLILTLIVLVNGYSKKDETKVLENSQDVIWSGTFQLAWNELIESCGTKVVFNDDISFVRTLNDKWFTKDMIDKNDYYIMVGETNFALKDKIKEEVKEKFARNDKTILNKMNFSDNKGITIYSTLNKTFDFINKFDELSNSRFGNSKENVKYFGINNKSDESLNNNVEVMYFDYSREDYVIKLKTKSNEEVLLYRCDINKPFDVLYNEIEESSKNFKGDTEFLEHDQIMIPYINLNVLIKYSELCNKVIKGTDGKFIRNAIEDVRFSLNENGVNLKSESVIQATMMSSYKDARYFLFNNNFVLFLKECDKEKPYFGIKIKDTEFLEYES